MNPGLAHLAKLEDNIMSRYDLSYESIEKVKDTAKYSLDQNPDQDKEVVLRRCMIAQMAEQMVADHMEGWVNHGIEDVNDPLTYAYDILCPVKYSGLRIEVKTHQSGSDWITVSTGSHGMLPVKSLKARGCNVGPFLQHGIADIIIFIDASEYVPGQYQLKPRLFMDRGSMHGAVRPSKFEGFYLNHNYSTNVGIFHKY